MKKNKAMIFWFSLPALLSLLIMFVYPVCRTVLMSFFRVESVTATMADWSFNGLENYFKIFNSASFMTSMRNMLLIWFVGGIFTLAIAMLMAVIVTSGIEGIPQDLYEAATIDGASKVAQFTRITLPLLKGVIKTSLTFWSINATTFYLWSKMFSPIDTESSTIVPVIYLYDIVFGGKGITQRDAGAGAAVGVVLTLIIIAVYLVTEKVFKGNDLEY